MTTHSVNASWTGLVLVLRHYNGIRVEICIQMSFGQLHHILFVCLFNTSHLYNDCHWVS